jgi:hypothetical protein
VNFRGGEFSTGTTGNFQPELTHLQSHHRSPDCSMKLPVSLVVLGQNLITCIMHIKNELVAISEA